MHLIAGRQRNAKPVQEVAQRRELFVGRRGVDAIHRRLVPPLEFLGGGDVGQHHEFLDQPVAVEARPRRDAAHHAVAVEHDVAFRQVEIERAARRARGEQGAERGVQMRETGSPRRAPAAPARRSAVRRCASGRGRNDARSCGRSRRSAVRRTGSRDPRSAAGCTSRWTAPRAASARRGRGNTRCCRGCAPRGRAPSRAARSARRRRWRRSGGSPRAGSGSANTASSKSRASSPSMVTSGMSRRSVRPPSGVARRASAASQRGGGKCLRDVVGVDGDQADRRRIAHFAKPLDNAGGFQAEPMVRHRFGQDDLTGFRTAVLRRAARSIRPWSGGRWA